MDDIPYLMVLFSVKWSQRGKGSVLIIQNLQKGWEWKEVETRRKSWGRGQATHPGPGAGSGLGYQGLPTLWTASGMRGLCLSWLLSHPFGVLGHYAGQAAVVVWQCGPSQPREQEGSLYTRQGPGGLLCPIPGSGFSVNFTASICNWEEVNYIIHYTWCVHAG